MSGLSVVPRCFPKISVIASSGAYGSTAVPTGILADAFYAKGEDHPDTLLNSVATLIQTSADQASDHQSSSAPVWIPRNGKVLPMCQVGQVTESASLTASRSKIFTSSFRALTYRISP